MNTPSTVEVLRGAKAVIERNGLHKGYFFSQRQHRSGIPAERCRVCVRGAVNLAAGALLPSETTEAAWEATKLLDIALRDRRIVGGVEDWNDLQSTTQADVAALLDEAIALAEGGAS